MRIYWRKWNGGRILPVLAGNPGASRESVLVDFAAHWDWPITICSCFSIVIIARGAARIGRDMAKEACRPVGIVAQH
jgi:hypothetical protein